MSGLAIRFEAMPARSLHEQRSSDSTSGATRGATLPEPAAESPGDGRSTSRRRFFGGVATAAGVCLAGCAGRLPGNTAGIDATTRTDGNTLLWDYPAGAAEGDDSDGIGYASIRFRALDLAETDRSVKPTLQFRLNSTVGDIAAGEPYEGYQADWFRFRVGVSRTYDDAAGLRAFVQPKQWPEIETTYGYRDGRRLLVVMAPDVNEAGTITVDGQFRPTGATLPRQLYCEFEVQASQPGLLGRTVAAAGRETFDLSGLDLPDSIAVA